LFFFSDDIINFLQKDYEYLQSFLSINICDQQTVQLLNKSASIQQISMIIELLRTGEKRGSHTSRMKINHFSNEYIAILRNNFVMFN